MNIDLIIQGPVDGKNAFLSHMDNICKQFNRVIISTWDSDDQQEWSSKLSKHDNVTIVSQELPPRPESKTGAPYTGITGDSTFYWACLSTYNGLLESTAEYIVKMRSDEYYENFSVLKKELRKSKNKFVFGNIFYKLLWLKRPYHLGDHVYATRKDVILNGIQAALEYYNGGAFSKEEDYHVKEIDQNIHCAEIVLAQMYLIGLGVPREDWDYYVHGEGFVTFKKYFKSVDINMMGDYLARWAAANTTFSPRVNPFVRHEWDR